MPIKYIKFRLAKINPKMDFEEQLSIMNSIYDDLAEKGFTITEIGNLIEQTIKENIQELGNKLKGLINDL